MKDTDVYIILFIIDFILIFFGIVFMICSRVMKRRVLETSNVNSDLPSYNQIMLEEGQPPSYSDIFTSNDIN